MERLLVLRLEALGCRAEAWLNGVPVARIVPGQAAQTVPVHEYTLPGGNEIELVVEPGGETAYKMSNGQVGAALRLLLPRVGSPAHPGTARSLAQLEWAPAAEQVYETPLSLRAAVDLPINFPRWRWLDAPPVTDVQALKPALAAYLREIAIGLAKGSAEPLIQASRLRLEELAQAYQRNLADEVGRLRLHIQQLHAAQPLKPALPGPADLQLRPVGGARLLECLAADGGPVLRSATSQGGRVAWPLRIAIVEGRPYVMR